jgi:hypothetical protein
MLENNQDLVDAEDITKEEMMAAAQAAGFESAADQPAPEFHINTAAHGIEHIKSRLILATTAWNNNFGYKRGVNILTTVFVSDVWPVIKEAVVLDVKKDATDLNEVMWKPIAYLINEIVTGSKNNDGKTYAAVLTTGQYVYLTLHGNNFTLLNSAGEDGEDLVVPATKIVMIRETGVTVPPTQSSDLVDGKYIRAVAPNKVPRIRYTLKEEQEKHSLKRATDKRRKANKVAKKQKSKARK